jgi:tetratricopeptide (TPR) repeat protein
VIRRLAGLAVMGLTVMAVACSPKTPPATAPSAPHYPDFMQPPTVPSASSEVVAELHLAWSQLQAGNTGGAERVYARVLKVAPGTAAALAGQGYVALARQDAERAVARFDEALAVIPSLSAALMGKGQALLQLERLAEALGAFEAAQQSDPLLSLAPRIETLRFRVVEDSIEKARALAKDGRWDDARSAYEAALRISPESAVLYRELAGVERRGGLSAEADAHLGRALELDPGDRATHILLAETREEAGDFDGAIASYEAALKLEPSTEIEARLARARERADLAHLPEEFQALSAKAEATRADLAAALALRVPGLLARAPARATPVITDLRGQWARPWIVATLRAGVLDAYPNHTFQPASHVRRAELALAVLRTLELLAAQGDRRAGQWQKATPEFRDVPPQHPAYAAAAQATAAGVLDAPDSVFAPTRSVSGQEVLEAVSHLQRLAGPLAGRDRR